MFAKDGYPTMALATLVAAFVFYLTTSFIQHWIGHAIELLFLVMWGIVIYFFHINYNVSCQRMMKVKTHT